MSLTDFTLTREDLRRRLRAALEDIEGRVEIQVQSGTFGSLKSPHLGDTEHDDERGLAASVEVYDIVGAPKRYVRSLPWIRLDNVEPEDLDRVLDEAVEETSRAVHLTVANTIKFAQEESTS